jgi:hypothetical protein
MTSQFHPTIPVQVRTHTLSSAQNAQKSDQIRTNLTKPEHLPAQFAVTRSKFRIPAQNCAADPSPTALQGEDAKPPSLSPALRGEMPKAEGGVLSARGKCR